MSAMSTAGGSSSRGPDGRMSAADRVIPGRRFHALKTLPSFYAAIESGAKNFEVRLNDRDFAVGDDLILKEWDPHAPANPQGSHRAEYTGRECRRCITYVLRGGEFGIATGYVVLGLVAVSATIHQHGDSPGVALCGAPDSNAPGAQIVNCPGCRDIMARR